MNQLSERYLEDFAVGQTFGSGRLRIDWSSRRALVRVTRRLCADPDPGLSSSR